MFVVPADCGISRHASRPPAVTPQRLQNRVFSPVDRHAPVAATIPVAHYPACGLHFHTAQLSVAGLLEGSRPTRTLTVVRQATDTSPPCFSVKPLSLAQ